MKFQHRFVKHPLGVLIFGVIFILAVSLACSLPSVDISPALTQAAPPAQQSGPTAGPGQVATQAVIPTLTLPPSSDAALPTGLPSTGSAGAPTSDQLVNLYKRADTGVVNISVFVNSNSFGQSGQAAGSGFVIDNQGHIITNNHVVEGESSLFVTFYNSTQMSAKVVGTDPQSDLAVIQVNKLPDGVQPLNLGDSSKAQVGEWVIAIGNPFALGTSMSAGIISATGRLIQAGTTPYSIPLAIQTDAAINPGNSGGPLIDMSGNVIGVNAQIATNGTNANAGVGFAIPSNIVRKVAPALIQQGAYTWPWLGISGTSVDLLIQQANNLPTQFGAYIDSITPGSPAEKAGLQGSTGSTTVDGVSIPTGGDVVTSFDGQQIKNFDDLLVTTDFKNPGDRVTLTVLRNGQQTQIPITLGVRPNNLPSSTNQP
jgi:2-alkenal reductase